MNPRIELGTALRDLARVESTIREVAEAFPDAPVGAGIAEPLAGLESLARYLHDWSEEFPADSREESAGLRPRLSLDEVNNHLRKAEKIVHLESRMSKTRDGNYVKTQTGLASRTIFVGYAFDEKRFICEDVS
jgi:hypothetical protein